MRGEAQVIDITTQGNPVTGLGVCGYRVVVLSTLEVVEMPGYIVISGARGIPTEAVASRLTRWESSDNMAINRHA